MLTEAYTEMNLQPKKNNLLGKNDIYVLDNELLREYVDSIYNEYGIQDPLVKWEENMGIAEKSRKKNVSSTQNYTYQTPDKSNNSKNNA